MKHLLQKDIIIMQILSEMKQPIKRQNLLNMFDCWKIVIKHLPLTREFSKKLVRNQNIMNLSCVQCKYSLSSILLGMDLL